MKFVPLALFAILMSLSPQGQVRADILLAGPVTITLTPSLSDPTILPGESEVLDLKITIQVGTNATSLFGSTPTVRFSSGDGQPDFLVTLPGITGSGATYTQDAIHTFTYSNPGLYTPSFLLSGFVSENANAGYQAPDLLTINMVGNFGVLQVGSVPEPSTWAMLLLGFAGIGFLTYRRRDRRRIQVS